jgi:hypothetical protein
MLGHELLGIDNLIVDVILELLLQMLTDDLKSSSLVMALEVSDVLEKKRPRSSGLDDSHQLKKQVSLMAVGKAVRSTEAALLAYTCD